jgi:hypothetical protein
MFLSVILSLLLSANVKGYFEPYKFEAQSWMLWTQVNFFNATSNYTRGGGSFNRLSDGNKYQLTQYDLGAYYTWSDYFRLKAEAQIASAFSENTQTQRRNFGFNYWGLGLEANWVVHKNFKLVPSVTYHGAVYQISSAADDVFIGEGVDEWITDLKSYFKWGSLEPFASLGFNYRGPSRSGLLTWSGGFEWMFRNSAIGIGLFGLNTVLEDEFAKVPASRESLASRNGSALKFYTVDPSLVDSQYWLRWGFKGPWQFQVGGGFTVTGSASAGGWNILAKVSYAMTPPPPEIKAKPEVERFEESTEDGVDQNLFQRPAPVPPKRKANPVEQTEGSQLKNKKNTELTQQLKDAEMQLELQIDKKSQRKRKGN